MANPLSLSASAAAAGSSSKVGPTFGSVAVKALKTWVLDEATERVTGKVAEWYSGLSSAALLKEAKSLTEQVAIDSPGVAERLMGLGRSLLFNNELDQKLLEMSTQLAEFKATGGEDLKKSLQDNSLSLLDRLANKAGDVLSSVVDSVSGFFMGSTASTGATITTLDVSSTILECLASASVDDDTLYTKAVNPLKPDPDRRRLFIDLNKAAVDQLDRFDGKHQISGYQAYKQIIK